MFKAPEFWNHRGGIALMLKPVSTLFTLAASVRRLLATEYHSDLPVICVGNITSGGTGKTPVVAYLCHLLSEAGRNPVVLSRGYGGRLTGPLLCDPAVHDAGDVGDEALMLSNTQPVCVARDRAEGASFIQRVTQADIIIMDDGMQNPWLKKDMTIAVFDGSAGLQNGYVLPAGPLRQTLASSSDMIDISVINGKDQTGLMSLLPEQMNILKGRLQPEQSSADGLIGRRFLAFAGIGRPKRFFDMLDDTEAEVIKTVAFADHHPFSEADLSWLHLEAQQLGAELITTMKDWARLPSEWREKIDVLPVFMQFSKEDETRLKTMITARVSHPDTGH